MKFAKSIFIIAILSCSFNFLFSMEKNAIMSGGGSGQTKPQRSLAEVPHQQGKSIRIDDRSRTGEGSEELNIGVDEEFIELDDANDSLEPPAGQVGDL